MNKKGNTKKKQVMMVILKKIRSKKATQKILSIKSFFVFIVLLFLFYSCIKKETTIIIEKTFYDNGNLNETFKIENGLKNGLYLKYYSNGSLQIKCFYKNGLKNGKMYIYLLNNRKTSELEWRNDTLVNEEIQYYYSGKVKSYTFRNIKGEICYYINYNSNGNKTKEWGCPFPQVMHSFKLEKEDTLFIDVYIVSPPKSSSKAVILEKNGNELDIFDKDSTGFRYSTWFTVSKKGYLPFRIKRCFYDSIDNVQKIDTISSGADFL